MKREKIKIVKHTFSFSLRTDALLRKMQKETESNFTMLVKEGLELLAEKKGIRHE